MRTMVLDIPVPRILLTRMLGRISTGAQLMAQGGHYAELYNTYFRHQSLEYIESFVG